MGSSALGDGLRRAAVLELLQHVGLLEQQRLVMRAVHDTVVVQERALAGIAVRGGAAVVDVGEDPAVGDVGLAVAVAVDVDVVVRAGLPRVEVRSAVGLLERDPVRDERDRVRLVRAGERVHVGVVVLRVPGGERRLAVAGGVRDATPQAAQSCRCQGDPGGREGDSRSAAPTCLCSGLHTISKEDVGEELPLREA